MVNEKPLVNKKEQPNVLEVEVEVEDEVKDEISTETVVTESDDMLNDVNLNNPNAQNKKKRKAKKK